MSGTDHLDESTWLAFFEGRLAAEAREAALDHVSSCERCGGIFRVARSAALSQVPDAKAPTPTTVSAPSWRLRPMVAFATTLIVALTSLIALRQPGTTTLPPPTSVSPAPLAAPSTAAPGIAKPAVVISGEQLLATRGDRNETAYLEALARALEPYQRDEFKEAARLLAPIAQDHADRFEPAFYLGASLLLDHRPGEAVKFLERAQALSGAARKTEATRLLEAARADRGQP